MGMLGKHHSIKTREKQRKSHIGKCLSKEHKRKISEAHTGKILSEDHKKKLRTPFKEIKNFVKNIEGYKLLSNEKDYQNQFSKLRFKCPRGHKFRIRWDHFKAGHRCKKCFKDQKKQYMLNGGAAHMRSFMKNPSKPQIKLFKLIKSIHSTAILEFPVLNYSIDIAIPNLKIAIEYDGSYWHRNKKKDNRRQKRIENEGWTFLRYRDYVPSLEDLSLDIFFKIVKGTKNAKAFKY